MSSKRKREGNVESGSNNSNMAESIQEHEHDGESEVSELESLYRCDSIQDISKCFANLHTTMALDIGNLKKDLSGVKKTVADIEASLSYAQEEITDIQEKDIPQLQRDLEFEKNERLKLELWGRKWNLIITGIPGVVREPAVQSEIRVREFLQRKLNMAESVVGNMLFQAVHRLPGRKQYPNIIVRFLSLIDKDRVFHAASNLPPNSGHAVFSDLPPELAKRRLDLLEKRRNLPDHERKGWKLKYLKTSPFIELVRKENQNKNGVGRGRGRGRLSGSFSEHMDLEIQS